jgi:transketolase
MNYVPGVDMSTGSLGQGLSAAVGMALGAKYQNKDFRVYALMGDGEIQEGQIWEACMAAAHYKLDNLVAIVDNNGLQIDGNVADVMSPYPIVDKLEAFGFHVMAIDAHDFDQIEAAFAEARSVKGKPSAIVMKSVKGKGVSFMENNAGWHGKAPNDAEYEQAMAELNAVLAELEGK